MSFAVVTCNLIAKPDHSSGKFLHRDFNPAFPEWNALMADSHRPFFSKYCPDSLEEDANIQADAPGVDVFHVKLYYVIEVCDAASAAYQPQACDAGLHGKSGSVMELVLFPFVYGRRTGAHQAHITLQHIKELREFIQAPFPNEVSDSFF